ncbi:type Z 30S ribosomal protein S14 [Candidatus Peregrinibacteria bacterium]|jgi:small subunit ribosomal protein S14|nr:type Z 30S ribosomal protein S14 [Candidatus Peregrinibacteria bacterium]MBT6401825.1 type Z 30S ribosomal protein S14 [candidate division WWE3 bacterium]MBT7736196.1 type Z 30S ribosomal protein S14 [Candidatus Peregrinibacteria bacterium]
MARTALIVKCNRRKDRASKEHAQGKKLTFPTRVHNRCEKCGKINGYMRRFGICRICFRELASHGKIMGVKKSSW